MADTILGCTPLGGMRYTPTLLPYCITAITDVFDALTSKRPYKEPFSVEKSLRIIEEGRGSHFDPAVHDVFVNQLDAILLKKKEYSEWDVGNAI